MGVTPIFLYAPHISKYDASYMNNRIYAKIEIYYIGAVVFSTFTDIFVCLKDIFLFP